MMMIINNCVLPIHHKLLDIYYSIPPCPKLTTNRQINSRYTQQLPTTLDPHKVPHKQQENVTRFIFENSSGNSTNFQRLF